MYPHNRQSQDSKNSEQNSEKPKALKKSLIKAHNKKEELFEQMKEDRQEKILNYLELHPGQTAYSLSKIFSYNIRYINESLKELANIGLIKLEKTIERNRVKLVASPLTIKDVNWNSFREENVDDPDIQKLIDRTISNGGSVWIHKNNDEIVELRPANVNND